MNSDLIGGTIDNSGLDQAIDNDLTPQEYKLGSIPDDQIQKLTSDFKREQYTLMNNTESKIPKSI